MTLLVAAAPAARRPRMPLTVGLALGWLGLILAVAVAADLLAPYGYATQDLGRRLAPPWPMGGTVAHVLGTDNLGRDLLSRLIYGVRISLLVAVLGTAISAVAGTALGFAAAQLRGAAEEAIMMLVDVKAALPQLIVALAVLAFFGNSLTLFILMLGFDGWDRYARLARGLVLSASASGYAAAARQLGARPARIAVRHILPNVVSALLVQVTLNFPGTILLETALSFLGLGIQPPLTSLGLMLGNGRNFLLSAWWLAVLPGAAIFLTTLSMSLFGDWLRDRLDPTLAD